MSNKSKGFKLPAALAGELALSDIGTVDTYGKMPWLALTVKNTHATQALTDFAVLVKNSSDGEWSTVWSDSDWATAANFRDGSWIGTSDTTSALINVLPAGEWCTLILFVGPAYAVKFQAKDGAGTATIEINGHAAGE